WVFGAQTSTLGLFLLLGSFFFIGLACWIYGKWGTLAKTRRVRLASLLAALAMLAFAGIAIEKAIHAPTETIVANTPSTSIWEPFSEERLIALQKEGVPVFVDFTAKWCLICQANHLVLSVKEVHEAFNQAGVVRMKADWTKGDPAITA